jgi:cell wall-associated NlpC family hydrolase
LKRLALLALVGGLVAVAATTPALGTPAAIRDKQAEAERVLAEIDQIDRQLETAIEAYNGATYHLEQIRSEIALNQRRLQIARQTFRRAQRNIQQRLVALYTNGEESTLEVALGASSLDDLLDRLDSSKRISQQDVRIVEEVVRARKEIARRERELERAEREQQKLVAERAAKKAAIQQQLGERQALLDSIKSEIERLKREEAERQRRLREEAERRLAATRAAQNVVQVPQNISSPEGIGTAPPSSYGGGVVGAAMSQLGVPYVWGGASPSGFDCSGLVVWAFAQAGRPGLPHYTGALWQMGVPVSYAQLAPGDLVFFYGGGHMGIYIGGGQFVHAPHTGDVVKVSDMSPGSHYYYNFLGARRL